MEWFIGIILPPFIDYLNIKIISEEEKVLVTILVCIVVACLCDWHLIQQQSWHNLPSLLTLAMVLVGEAMTIYKLYWKNSTLRKILPGNGIPS